MLVFEDFFRLNTYMKATIEIDATPKEMRELLGLPDVEALQKETLEKIREKMMAAIETNDMAAIMKLYMPMPDQMATLQGVQSSLWDVMRKNMTLSEKEEKSPD